MHDVATEQHRKWKEEAIAIRNANWTYGTPKELVALLKLPGKVEGHCQQFPTPLTLHKGDLITALEKIAADSEVIWKIIGNPRLPRSTATVIVWLGGRP
jgi:hypothetical protein